MVAVGDPDVVNICHCTACQRRSGAPLTSMPISTRPTFIWKAIIKPIREAQPRGGKLHNHFCPNCGTTVCWTLDVRPDYYGIAIGAFNETGFPAPTVSIWEASKFDWVTVPAEIEHFSRGLPSES